MIPQSRFIYYHTAADQHIAIVIDFEWYVANQPEIEAWMQENLVRGRDTLLGMILTFDNEAEATTFLLKWN
jgi:hypothetical protein